MRDDVANIGAVEAGNELARLFQCQPFDDLAARRRIGGRGQRDARHIGEALVQYGQCTVFGTEIMAPLRDAMRLVDREQRDPRCFPDLFQQREKAGHQQAFRGNIEQVEFAAQQPALHLARGIGADAGIEESGFHAELAQRIDLILHQRDQRRNHDARPPDAAARESGNTAICRRRSASAPAHRRPQRHVRRLPAARRETRA